MSQIPTPEISYYLIHNGEEKRLVRMLSQFDKYGLDISKINMIITPNKDDLTPDIINSIVQTQPSISNNNPIKPEYLLSRRGLVVCCYKHYLALKDAAEKNTEYTVIMEDNAEYTENVFAMLPTYIQQLNTVYNGEWDILFNCINNEWGRYIYQPIKSGLFVYPKSNEINNMCAGSTKSARFYLIRREFARRLSEVFLPFNNGPDLWMNDLFRQLGARSFWVEPANVAVENNHKSTTECLC